MATSDARPGEIRFRGKALWWRSPKGEWRIAPSELWTRDDDVLAWRRPDGWAPYAPKVMDVVYTPVASRDLVVAVRVIRVAACSLGVVIRGWTADEHEVNLDSTVRTWFEEPVEAALQLHVPPRLHAVVEFD